MCSDPKEGMNYKTSHQSSSWWDNHRINVEYILIYLDQNGWNISIFLLLFWIVHLVSSRLVGVWILSLHTDYAATKIPHHAICTILPWNMCTICTIYTTPQHHIVCTIHTKYTMISLLKNTTQWSYYTIHIYICHIYYLCLIIDYIRAQKYNALSSLSKPGVSFSGSPDVIQFNSIPRQSALASYKRLHWTSLLVSDSVFVKVNQNNYKYCCLTFISICSFWQHFEIYHM